MYYEQDFLKKHNGLYIENTWAGNSLEMQSYPFMILVYIAHGSGILKIDNNNYKMNEGDIVLINPKVEHGFYSTLQNKSLGVYCCCFDELFISKDKCIDEFPELSNFFGGVTTHLKIQDTTKKDIRNYIIRMLDDFIYSQPGYEYTAKCLLTMSVITVFRLFIKERIKKTPMNTNVIVGAVTNYVNKNIYKKFCINDISNVLHLSPDYICRVFKKYTNMSFSQFVMNSRVDKIKDALENTDRPVYLICEDFEFTSQYLNRMFKKITGYSMNDYKRLYNYKSNNTLYKLQ